VHPATLNKDIALLEVDGFNKFKLLLARDVNMAATGHDRTVLLQKGKWTTPKLWSRGQRHSKQNEVLQSEILKIVMSLIAWV